MRRIPVPVIVAFGIVVAVVVVTAILNSFNGGLGHTPYIAALWTVIAIIGLAIYYVCRTVLQRIRRGNSHGAGRQVLR